MRAEILRVSAEKRVRKSAKGLSGTVIDASDRFGSRATPASIPLERIVFNPADSTCRAVPMSADDLQRMIELLKGQFDELLEQRRAEATANKR
jgi:hypothetical protein